MKNVLLIIIESFEFSVNANYSHTLTAQNWHVKKKKHVMTDDYELCAHRYTCILMPSPRAFWNNISTRTRSAGNCSCMNLKQTFTSITATIRQQQKYHQPIKRTRRIMQKIIKMAYIHKQCSWKIHKKLKYNIKNHGISPCKMSQLNNLDLPQVLPCRRKN